MVDIPSNLHVYNEQAAIFTHTTAQDPTIFFPLNKDVLIDPFYAFSKLLTIFIFITNLTETSFSKCLKILKGSCFNNPTFKRSLGKEFFNFLRN